MSGNQEPMGNKRKSLLKITKKGVLTFLGGMVLAILLGVGIQAAVNPSFLAGTTSNINEITRYRMFAANASIPAVDQADKYLGEIVPMYVTSANTQNSQYFVASSGQTMSLSANAALFSAIGSSYGVDASYQNFNLPDFSNVELANNITYYIDVGDTYPMPGGKAETVKNGIAYVAANDSYDPENSSSEFGYFTVNYGEITLFKTTDPALISDNYIPCEGQLLTAEEYPNLAATVFSNQKVFRIPDLSDQSPIAGAEYYICANMIVNY